MILRTTLNSVVRILTFSLLILGYSVHAQISGVVENQKTLEPVANALVTLQATNIRATTGPDGSFELSNATGENLVIVAAKKGYYNSSLIINSSDTNAVIMIEPVLQDDDSSYVFTEPNSCTLCHPNQYNEWNNSPMSLAGENTWLYDIYNGSGTEGGMGGFVYTRDSRHSGINPESECAACHQPEPWINEPFIALEDINNLSSGAVHGISCEVCHKVAHIDESKPNYPGIYPGVVSVTRPADSSTQVQYGVLGDASYIASSMMRPSYQPQLSAALCASCHQDKNDPDNDGDFEEENGVISEPTYIEWLESPYADSSSMYYATCVDCHMPPTGADEICSLEPVTRNPETIRGHRIEGTTSSFLENAVEMEMDTQIQDSTISVEVRLINSNTGHHVPTGVTIRNMILLVEAWQESDSLQLNYTGEQIIHDLGGIGDRAQGYYAGLPGKFYAKHNHDSSGNGPTFFTDATGIIFDNRIPALMTDTSHYSFTIPDEEIYHIRARLIYRRSFRFLTDAKGWTEDGHGNPLKDILPPYFGYLMEEKKWDSIPTAIENRTQIPEKIVLSQNWPNPFNPTTTIQYYLKTNSPVYLSIFDISGKEIVKLVNEIQSAGEHSIKLDASGWASGIYYYKLKAGSFNQSKKMLLLH